MRVALLNANAPARDAVGNHLAEKAAFFADRGADVRVFVLSGDRLHPGVRGFCRVLADAQPSGDAWTFASRADMVIADFSQYHPLLDWLPLLACHRPRLLVDYHGVTPATLCDPQQREPLEQGERHRGLAWFADAVITHSRFAQRELVNATGLPAERCFDLGYVIDSEQFQPTTTGIIKHRLGLEDAAVLLFVGRVAPNKRLPILVEALAQLRDEAPPVHAVVIGDTSDVYRLEADRCIRLAAERGVADRLHLLGQVDARLLRDAYNSADVLVIPSVHEGFSLPVREAMACGLPVLAARAGALPEAVGSAGLTFTPDDSADLARQVRRVLDVANRLRKLPGGPASGDTPGSLRSRFAPPPDATPSSLRVAVVACRYGSDVVGGAETSLRTIAESLHSAGHSVEVFTTTATTENDPGTEASEEDSVVNGIVVHRSQLDPRDPVRFASAQERLTEPVDGAIREREADYLADSMRSTRLIGALRLRIDDFDAVIAGPYLHGLTHHVARVFPDKALILPCFHDEPAARLSGLRDAYSSAGGILYHSPEEQKLAEVQLGVNHPRGSCIGTWIDVETLGHPERGRRQAGAERYVLYAGRYAPQKNLPLLLAHARRYAEEHPGQLRFVFIGGGDFPIPRASWAVDLGHVDEATKRDLIAGAAALVQLSQMESLSLVVLEAWAQGVPVIVHRQCAVLTGQLDRAKGGWAVGDYESFAAALDDLGQKPKEGQALGLRGQEYVRREYGSSAVFVERLEKAIVSLNQPLPNLMKQGGLVQAMRYRRPAWRAEFDKIIEELLHSPPRQGKPHVEVQPRTDQRRVPTGLSGILVPVRVHNKGSQAVAADGLARWVLRVEVRNDASESMSAPAGDTMLPSLLAPGQTVPAAVRVPVPEQPGSYEVLFRAEPAMNHNGPTANHEFPALPESSMQLMVETGTNASDEPLGSFLQTVEAALVQAEQYQQLPDGYADVTQGLFASVKLGIKSKLLNNFKRAYVDVLSRQQSSFNWQVLQVLHELAECCGTLAHAQGTCAKPQSDVGANPEQNQVKPPSLREQELIEELAQNRRQIASLERRLARLEALLLAREMVIT